MVKKSTEGHALDMVFEERPPGLGWFRRWRIRASAARHECAERPHRGSSRLIVRISSRTSSGTIARPGLSCRILQVQNRRNPFRRHAITVSGLTMTRALRQLLQITHSHDHKIRSTLPSLTAPLSGARFQVGGEVRGSQAKGQLGLGTRRPARPRALRTLARTGIEGRATIYLVWSLSAASRQRAACAYRAATVFPAGALA